MRKPLGRTADFHREVFLRLMQNAVWAEGLSHFYRISLVGFSGQPRPDASMLLCTRFWQGLYVEALSTLRHLACDTV